MIKRSLILPVLAVSALAAGCGGGGYGDQATTKPAAAKTAARGATRVVEMTGSTFAPRAVDVKVGETVSFVNKDEIAHTATADGTFDSGTMDAGATFEFVARKAGTINYVCLFHPGMTGTLNVS